MPRRESRHTIRGVRHARLAVFAFTVAAGAVLAAGDHASVQQRSPDSELARALVARDVTTALPLLTAALAEPLPLPQGHDAAPLLGPTAAADLASLFEARPGDRAAAGRINNIGVALVLRGWAQSAAVAFGGALRTFDRITPAGPWFSIADTLRLPPGISMRNLWARGSPIMLNVDNFYEVERARQTAPEAPRLEFAQALVEDAVKHPSPADRLRAMAEVFPPVISRAFDAALSNPPTMRTTNEFGRAYQGFAQYKGVFLRGLRTGRFIEPPRATAPPPTVPLAPKPAPPATAPSTPLKWDRSEVWDDRGVYGFIPAQRLQSGEAIVDLYLVARGRSLSDLRNEYVAVVDSAPNYTGAVRANQRHVISLGSAERIDAALDAFWDDLYARREKATPAALAVLARMIWEPARRLLPEGTMRVWIAPDGRLTQAPWQALSIIDAGRGEAPAITVVDGGDTIRRRQAPATPAPERMLIAGDADYGSAAQPRFARLHGTADEIKTVTGLARAHRWETTILTGRGVTAPALLKALPARIVHVATHGEFRPARFRPPLLAVGPWVVMDPALATADRQSPRDRVDLTPFSQAVLALSGANTLTDAFAVPSPAALRDVDFASIDLRGTELVVLSACDLGQAEQSALQGLGSMQFAIPGAGARALLSSLWQVADAEGGLFMRAFYTQLLERKQPPAEALRDAQRAASIDAAGRPRSPYLWAGWVLFGDSW